MKAQLFEGTIFLTPRMHQLARQPRSLGEGARANAIQKCSSLRASSQECGAAQHQETAMANSLSLGRRFEAYRPTKAIWFWSSAGCIVATIVVGFAWGGWVTGGTATRMASDAADGARAQLVAMSCVTRFGHGPDAAAQLAALKKADSYQRGDLIVKGGWVTMPGSADPVAGAADICVDKLINADLKTETTVKG
jgi:hypothetical protein